jgi:hypothetical protein
VEIKRPVSLPDTMDVLAANGHTMTYRVTGLREDGRYAYSQWDAWHSDKCRCMGEDPVPEW